jgi:glutamate-5-semialdehyde dehydrogenase
VKRLKFDDSKLKDVIAGIEDLIGLPDPVGQSLLRRRLDDGLILERVTCPIGVIGVIFESRPDALVQIAALCLKSGNCAILKGGSEALHTNRALYQVIQSAGIAAGIPDGFLALLESRSEISELLQCHESIDLIIPRGSNEFVRYIMDHSEIPVMGHSDGICHVYADQGANLAKAIPIIRDSKIQYPAACNAAETILIHADIAESLLPPLCEELREHGVTMRGTARVKTLVTDVEEATEADFKREYLDYILNLHIVGSINEAINHINTFGSHHTDCIITEDSAAAALFMQRVDSASVYQNCSTRFADGFRYGLGAEVGISTGKLHARGPVGLEGLQTYKYKLYGNGQIVADYAEGRKSFHFETL